MLDNSDVEADVALAALGTTQLNTSRWTDKMGQLRPVCSRLAAGAPRMPAGDEVVDCWNH
jgi:hypothetical protein